MKTIYDLIFLILCLNFCFIIGCKKKNYPNEIIKFNLQNEFDSAKWWLYSSNYHNNGIFCESLEKTFNDSVLNIVSCNTELDYLLIKGDTIEMKLYFKNNLDTSFYCNTLNGDYINTFIFIKGENFLYRISHYFGYNSEVLKLQKDIESDTNRNTGFEKIGFYTMRVENKMFPEFLRTTKAKLNPWLKQEAIKRGILK